MLDGIIQPSSGELYIDGEPVNASGKTISRRTLQKMGFIFQQPNMLPWYTIRQNVMLPLKILGIEQKESRDYADSLIEMVGLAEHASAYPLEISGGMLQRAGVIRAMVHKPEILLMDEPFGALDEMTREQLNMELLEIWKKLDITIIFITHNVEEAILLSSRVYVMGTQPGRLVETVDIGLPRPRGLGMITEQRFADYEMQLTSLIGELELRNIK
jgi:NitT/TauT family transport system ATP-binding protein